MLLLQPMTPCYLTIERREARCRHYSRCVFAVGRRRPPQRRLSTPFLRSGWLLMNEEQGKENEYHGLALYQPLTLDSGMAQSSCLLLQLKLPLPLPLPCRPPFQTDAKLSSLPTTHASHAFCNYLRYAGNSSVHACTYVVAGTQRRQFVSRRTADGRTGGAAAVRTQGTLPVPILQRVQHTCMHSQLAVLAFSLLLRRQLRFLCTRSVCRSLASVTTKGKGLGWFCPEKEP
ncbi:hypothetical protein IWZ03DRAFT_378799 [Phyllosticta citriasiana]|uniref:Uncharacterized protein n=1 Tax=Phyllosticta citriasiana TaxID=595635 RepID=A0ABR1KKU5_9PEZI